MKWGINAGYALAAGLVVYGSIVGLGWAVSLFRWLCSVEFLTVFAEAIFVVLALTAGLFFALKLSVVQRCAGAAGTAIRLASPPLALVWTVLTTPFRWLSSGLYKVREFVAVFYEENCPPISIVSEEEERIEESVNA